MPSLHPLPTALALLLLQTLTPSTSGNTSILSGSNARLPASLSSVINDLEAEGASRITTAAFLSSQGVTKKSRASLLASLFGPTSDDYEDDDESDEASVEVTDGLTTAFGKKIDDLSALPDSPDLGSDSEADPAPSLGIAVANPLPTASVSEIAATVHACAGNVVYVCSPTDLSRGEGLFDTLAPAIERLLHADAAADDGSPPPARTLVVVVEGATTQHQLVTAKARLESAADSALESIVQPASLPRATALRDVFSNVEYVSSTNPVDELLGDVADSRDPSAAAAGVACAVFQGTGGGNVPALVTPEDLAAARRLMPLSHRTVARCVEVVRAATEGEEEGEERAVADFGGLCDAAVETAMEEFAEGAGPGPLAAGAVAEHIRGDLEEELYAELEGRYVAQLELAYRNAVESFRGDLSGLRLSPNLDTDMQDAASRRIATFAGQVGSLRSKSGRARGWVGPDVWVGRLRRELREYVGLRIRTARADGKFKPIPRKGVTLGFHWLLPKPFGNDYRLEPWQRHTKDSVVYIPKDKITDVATEEVKTGDWRKGVVPCPTGKEMMYLK